MANNFDLNLFSLACAGGQYQTELTGLYVAEAPRRTARSRGDDRLIFYLTLEGNLPLLEEKQSELLAQVAKTYYDTPGSVTAALRAAADALNQFLLERNLRSSASGRQAEGLLTQLVLRGDQFYLAQSGPVHAFLIAASKVRYWHEPEIAGRGLGLAKTSQVYFCQSALEANDTILITHRGPLNWTPAGLVEVHGQGPESLRRRLLPSPVNDYSAVVGQARPGAGKITLLRGRTALPGALPNPDAQREPVVKPAPVQVVTEQAVTEKRTAALYPPSTVPVEPPTPSTSIPPLPVAGPESEREQRPAFIAPASAAGGLTRLTPTPPAGQPAAQEQKPARRGWLGLGGGRKQERAPKPQPSDSGAKGISKPVGKVAGKFGSAFRTLLSRLLPDEAFGPIPSSTMALIAVAIPILIVTIASVVYVRRGLFVHYDAIFSQALESAQQAESQTDLLAQRNTWRATLDLVRQAESYRLTPEAMALRQKVLKALDELDLIRRPNLQPAIIGGLPDNVSVTRMVISDNDLYLLDGKSGVVLRALVTLNGYELDRSFQCGSSSTDTDQASPIVDISAWPPENEPQAAILALDSSGNVYYCVTNGEQPEIVALAAPSSIQWGNLKGFTLDMGHIYVLDPRSNAVWVYWNGKVEDTPEFFFSREVPQMDDVIDLAVNNNELYLLHEDGRLTLCNYSGLEVSPTRCVDPLPYVDLRPGRENTQLIPPSPYTQILYSQPPDPSLYLLEAKSQAIYHFSLRSLTFQRQYLPQDALETVPATAFTVNEIDRTLFLAFGNQVYHANIP